MISLLYVQQKLTFLMVASNYLTSEILPTVGHRTFPSDVFVQLSCQETFKNRTCVVDSFKFVKAFVEPFLMLSSIYCDVHIQYIYIYIYAHKSRALGCFR